HLSAKRGAAGVRSNAPPNAASKSRDRVQRGYGFDARSKPPYTRHARRRAQTPGNKRPVQADDYRLSVDSGCRPVVSWGDPSVGAFSRADVGPHRSLSQCLGTLTTT